MLTYNLEQRNDEPKYYYIYKMIRRDIERGKLKKGEKLPSKRSLAEHLGISLITVENAYQMLKDEGYIEPRERSGYYVCEIHVIGESLLKHNYDKALKNPIHDKTVPIRDTYRREQAYKSAKHSEIKFQVNDVVTHPKFGEGTVEEIVQLSNSVRLHIRFADDEVKKIDQKWLLRSGHK